MPTTMAIRFPLGRYHATAWNRSVNEGATEWPPSPWRILRALVATWYTRWPDLAAPELDALLEALGEPPAYLAPPAMPGHSRHYLPGLDHRKGETAGTDLTLDPFLSVSRAQELLVRWEADLPAGQREILAKLAELMPYLGRAESVCEARLLNDSPELDASWWLPDVIGTQYTRLLAPARPVSRPALEISTVEVRRSRRTQPLGTTWVRYVVPELPKVAKRAAPAVLAVTAIRFAVLSRAPLMSANGILLADEAHRVAGYKLIDARVPDERRREILGSKGAGTDHRHSHWIPIAGTDKRVSSLVLWTPDGLAPEEVAAMTALREISGQLGEGKFELHGLPNLDLVLQAAGSVEQVAPELSGPARIWTSSTPYLPVRHRKRESLDEFVSSDVRTELRYRGLPPASVSRTDEADGLPDRWSRDFRRYRAKEHLGEARPGVGLRIEFAEEVRGPLLLGQLSHFGFGIFVPELK